MDFEIPNVYEIPINRCVPYYLMSSFLYYKGDKTILEDGDFDYMCKRLYDEWDNITHYHKHLLDKDSLRAGTGYELQYNTRISSAASQWYEDYLEHEKKNKKEEINNT